MKPTILLILAIMAATTASAKTTIFRGQNGQYLGARQQMGGTQIYTDQRGRLTGTSNQFYSGPRRNSSGNIQGTGRPLGSKMKIALALVLFSTVANAQTGYQSTDQIMQSHGQSLSSPSSPKLIEPKPYSRTPNMPPLKMKKPPGPTPPGRGVLD